MNTLESAIRVLQLNGGRYLPQAEFFTAIQSLGVNPIDAVEALKDAGLVEIRQSFGKDILAKPSPFIDSRPAGFYYHFDPDELETARREISYGKLLERDKYLVEHRGEMTDEQLGNLLPEVGEARDWEKLTANGVRKAVTKYCNHFGVSKPQGKPGRPT